MKTEGRRSYRMTNRATSASATSEAILDAVTGLFWEHPTDQVVLRDVAERAGVTVQTVIRRFGGREGLLAAAADRTMSRTRAERATPPGDIEAALDVLMDHYEQAGAGVLRLLAEEHTSPTLGRYAAQGRVLHRDWCRSVFGPALTGLTGLNGVARARRLAQIVAVCDVYTWKLLHIDAGLSRRQTRLAILELLGPLLSIPVEDRSTDHHRESR